MERDRPPQPAPGDRRAQVQEQDFRRAFHPTELTGDYRCYKSSDCKCVRCSNGHE